MLNLKLNWSKNKSSIRLIIWVVLTTALIFGFWQYIGAWRYYNQPSSFYFSTKGNLIFFITIILLLLSLALINIIFYRLIDWEKPKNWKTALIIFILISLGSTLLFPLTSSDLFCYLSIGRIYGLHHLSPYLHTYLSLPADNFFPTLKNIVWADKFTPYGPIAIYIDSLIAWLAGSKIVTAIISFKLLALITNSVNAWLIYKLAGRKAFFLYAFNPLIIFEILINGHNEGLVILFILLTLLLQKRKQKIYSWAALTLAALTKISTIIFLPLFFLRELKQRDKKMKLAWKMIGLFLIVSLVLYYPLIHCDWLAFGRALELQGAQKNPYFYSPVIVIGKVIFLLLKIKASTIWAITTGRAIFILAYLYLLISIIINKETKTLNYYLIISYGLLCLTALTWLMPWYLTVLSALLIVDSAKAKNSWQLNLNYFITICTIPIYLFLR